jgi:hypothetical protein
MTDEPVTRPPHPLTPTEIVMKRVRLLMQATYYQKLSAIHYQLWTVMADYFDPAGGDYPYDQIVQFQNWSAQCNRMARRALFATIGD